jgi:hypothetical protein
VVREFANHADLIVFFFDPEKPGTTGESLRIFTDALSDVMYKVLIVFNKVDTFGDVRDFARTFGALCWNLSRVVRTKDMPYIYCTYLEEFASGTQRQIDLADFAKSTRQLEEEVRKVGDRRRSNVVGALLDASRSLSVHASVVRAIGVRLLVMRLAIWFSCLVLLAVALWLFVAHRTNNYLLTASVVAGLSGVIFLVLQPFIARWKLNKEMANLDVTFRSLFQQELLEHNHPRYLEGLWESVKPRVVKFLSTVGPRGIPASLWDGRRIVRLRRMAESEIPKLISQS